MCTAPRSENQRLAKRPVPGSTQVAKLPPLGDLSLSFKGLAHGVLLVRDPCVRDFGISHAGPLASWGWRDSGNASALPPMLVAMGKVSDSSKASAQGATVWHCPGRAGGQAGVSEPSISSPPSVSLLLHSASPPPPAERYSNQPSAPRSCTQINRRRRPGLPSEWSRLFRGGERGALVQVFSQLGCGVRVRTDVANPYGAGLAGDIHMPLVRRTSLWAGMGRRSPQRCFPCAFCPIPAVACHRQVLQTVPKFCFPFDVERVSKNQVGQNFTFVLTDIESKQRFGFCRLTSGCKMCICLLSYLPWFEIFYKLLNTLADYLMKRQESDLNDMLETLYELAVPKPNTPHSYFIVPDINGLPTIPESRNLTEYFVAVDVTNMLQLYASLLHERRVIITSSKLSTLTACVHGAATMLFPMHWQHIYIPVLPPHLLDYCCAPMPYLIGVHLSLLERVKSRSLEDVVILNVDTNTIESSIDDLHNLPSDVVSSLKSKLKKQSTATGSGVARAFLRSQAALFGSYRDALRYKPGEPITFCEDSFVAHRSSTMRSFLEMAVNLQLFKQFIDDRLAKLNAGRGFTDIFEEEITEGGFCGSNSWSYQQWMHSVKKGVNKASPAVKSAYKIAKVRARKGLWGVKDRIRHKVSSTGLFFTLSHSTHTHTYTQYAQKSATVVQACRVVGSRPVPGARPPARLMQAGRGPRFSPDAADRRVLECVLPCKCTVPSECDGKECLCECIQPKPEKGVQEAEEEDGLCRADSPTSTKSLSPRRLQKRRHERQKSPMSMGFPEYVIDGEDELDTASKISSEDSGEMPSYTEDSDDSYELEPETKEAGQMNLLEEILDSLNTTSIEQGKLSAAKSLDFFRSMDDLDCSLSNNAKSPSASGPGQGSSVVRMGGGEPSGRNMVQDDSIVHGKHLPPSPRRQCSTRSWSAPITKPSKELAGTELPQLSQRSSHPDPLLQPPVSEVAKATEPPTQPDSPLDPQPNPDGQRPATCGVLRRKVLSRETLRHYQERSQQGGACPSNRHPSVLVPWEKEQEGHGEGTQEHQEKLGVQEKGLLEEIEAVCRLSMAMNSSLQLAQVHNNAGLDKS
ncbi:hypothetical protein P4O66_013044 [Electrophorus voltai]|uniref:UDENN domain-containing protein n=1 Tax=Electrophorus voltai TaxID=2609070 RepID=A0AAD9E8Q5_9TELE|nr:hypothetical protein P4O66_013044 [Electrophorus voltai]